MRWKTHRETWASLLNQLDTVEDIESVILYWRPCAQVAKELNEALETETDKIMFEGGKSSCDALAWALASARSDYFDAHLTHIK